MHWTNKKIITLWGIGTALLLTMTSAPATCNSTANPIQKKKISPKNTLIIFDIDDVLLKKTGSVVDAIWEHKYSMARGLIRPSLWIEATQMLISGAAAGQWQTFFTAKQPELADLVHKVARGKEPIAGTVLLVKQLHEKGYSLHLASNMGAEDFRYFQQKYPEIFSYFKSAKVIEYSAEPDEKPIKKPNRTYFIELAQELDKKEPTKTVRIFIDDSASNIETAEQTELFIGILFKNSEQLQEELRNKGVLKSQGFSKK